MQLNNSSKLISKNELESMLLTSYLLNIKQTMIYLGEVHFHNVGF